MVARGQLRRPPIWLSKSNRKNLSTPARIRRSKRSDSHAFWPRFPSPSPFPCPSPSVRERALLCAGVARRESAHRGKRRSHLSGPAISEKARRDSASPVCECCEAQRRCRGKESCSCRQWKPPPRADRRQEQDSL